MSLVVPGWWPWAAVGAAAAAPVLAGWSSALVDGVQQGWWRPRRVNARRVGLTALLSVVLVVGAVAAPPWPAWAAFAAVGAVLITVDWQIHQLPARLVYPAAAVIAAILLAWALASHSEGALLRAVAAGSAVGGSWLLVAFIAPVAVGLGDVRLYAVSAALLGWIGWGPVLTGQFLAAVVAALMLPVLRGRHVPMGPAIVASTVIAAWL